MAPPPVRLAICGKDPATTSPGKISSPRPVLLDGGVIMNLTLFLVKSLCDGKNVYVLLAGWLLDDNEQVNHL